MPKGITKKKKKFFGIHWFFSLIMGRREELAEDCDCFARTNGHCSRSEGK